MKKLLASFILGSFVLVGAATASAVSPFDGALIALDAGHGGTETGAINVKYGVREKDVNLEVALALRDRLVASGAQVFMTRTTDETISSRKDRVAAVNDQCFAAGGRKCDILVSIHHNGSTDPNHDGTLTIYNEKQDIPLAKALHDSLLQLTGLDEGYLNGGYGMTVYEHLVSTLTEAYYITNDSEAEQYLAGTRVPQEVDAQFMGISNYFLSHPVGGGSTGGRGKSAR